MGLDNPVHILLLLIVVLLVFGAKRLPEIGRSLGEGMRGFKETLTGDIHRETITQAPAASESTAADHAHLADQAPVRPESAR